MNHQICRCCGIENPENFFNIFEESRLRLELAQCLSHLNIEFEDGLPDIVCLSCKNQVQEINKFLQKCEQTDRVLRQRCEEANKAIDVALDEVDLECLDSNVLLNLDSLEPEILEEDEMCINTQDLVELEPEEATRLKELLQNDFSFSQFSCLSPRINSNNNSNNINEIPSINQLVNKVLLDPCDDNAVNDFMVPKTREHYQVMPSPIIPYISSNPKQYSQLSYQNLLDSSNSTSSCSTSSNSENSGSSLSMPIAKKNISISSSKSNGNKSVYPCSECNKKFTRNFQLKLHLISVHNIGNGLQYSCNICHKTFASRHSLKYHIKSLHSEERPFSCQQCDKRFILKTQLASHMRIHTGDPKPRPLVCNVCGKTWPTKSVLNTHMRSHDPSLAEKRFECPHCDKKFFTRGHLESHILVHTGEKPFSCSICNKSYQSVGNLNHHMERCHSAKAVRHKTTVATK